MRFSLSSVLARANRRFTALSWSPSPNMLSVQRKSVEGSASEKGSASREGEDEKRSQIEEDVTSVADSYEADEALRLVGRERTTEFSEEYNKKLRRKLVRHYIDRRSDLILMI